MQKANVGNKGQGGAGDITPEMIAAGLKVFYKWEESSDYSQERLVRQIYSQMRKARNLPPKEG